MYEAFGRRDVTAILSHLAEDVTWDVTDEPWTPHAAGVPWLLPRRGHAEVAEFFAIAGAWEYERFEVLDLLVSDTQVAAEVRLIATLPDGERLDEVVMHLWTFGDGRLGGRAAPHARHAPRTSRAARVERPRAPHGAGLSRGRRGGASAGELDLRHGVGASRGLLGGDHAPGGAEVAAGAADELVAVEAQQRAAERGVAVAVRLGACEDALQVVAADRLLRVLLVGAAEVERVDLERRRRAAAARRAAPGDDGAVGGGVGEGQRLGEDLERLRLAGRLARTGHGERERSSERDGGDGEGVGAGGGHADDATSGPRRRTSRPATELRPSRAGPEMRAGR